MLVLPHLKRRQKRVHNLVKCNWNRLRIPWYESIAVMQLRHLIAIHLWYSISPWSAHHLACANIEAVTCTISGWCFSSAANHARRSPGKVRVEPHYITHDHGSASLNNPIFASLLAHNWPLLSYRRPSSAGCSKSSSAASQVLALFTLG